MRLTEAEYKKLCLNKNIKYEEPKPNKLKEIENVINKKEWDKRRKNKPFAKMNQSETFVIDGRLPGLNSIIQAAKYGPFSYSSMKSEYSQIVEFSALEQLKFHYKLVDIQIHWIEPNKKRDKDNIAAGVKFILDGLVDAAILEEDGWSQVNNIKHQYSIDKTNPRIEVTLVERRDK